MALKTVRQPRGDTPEAPAEAYEFVGRIDPGTDRDESRPLNHAGIFVVRSPKYGTLLVEKRMPFFAELHQLALTEIRVLRYLQHQYILHWHGNYVYPRDTIWDYGTEDDNDQEPPDTSHDDGYDDGGEYGILTGGGLPGGAEELSEGRRVRGHLKERRPPGLGERNRMEACLITEYCSFGSLVDLRNRMVVEGQRLRDSGCSHTDTNATARLPEAFMWYVLFAMARALEYLAHGTDATAEVAAAAEAGASPAPGGESILHRDVKPDNIFLRDRNDAQGPPSPPRRPPRQGDVAFATALEVERAAAAAGYPEPVLGDFGWATGTNDRHLRAEQNRPSGTPLYQGPEQPKHDLRGRSDVYGLGASIDSICTRARRNWRKAAPLRDEAPRCYASENGYSRALCDALMLLMANRTGDRPQPPDLVARLAALYQRAAPLQFDALPAWAAPTGPRYSTTEAARRTYYGLKGLEDAYWEERKRGIKEGSGVDKTAKPPQLPPRAGENLVNVLLKFRRSDFGRIEVRDNTVEEVAEVVEVT